MGCGTDPELVEDGSAVTPLGKRKLALQIAADCGFTTQNTMVAWGDDEETLDLYVSTAAKEIVVFTGKPIE